MFDDIASSQLAGLEVDCDSLTVYGGVLHVGTLTAGDYATNTASTTVIATASGTLTAETIQGASATYGASGTGSLCRSDAPSDRGEIYLAAAGGMVRLASAPAAASTLVFASNGTIALDSPSVTEAAALVGLDIGDTLESPGHIVRGVAFGSDSLTMVTDLGSVIFSNVTYAPPPSSLHGGNRAPGSPCAMVSHDDLPALSLNSLSLNQNAAVNVTARARESAHLPEPRAAFWRRFRQSAALRGH